MLCVECSIYGAETWTLRRNEQKRLVIFAMWIWRRKNNAGTDKEEKKKLAGPLVKKELTAEGCSRRNGKRENGSRQNKILDDKQYHDK